MSYRKTPTTGISVIVLGISSSGKAIQVMDPDLPYDIQTLWIPCSLLDEESLVEAAEAAEQIGGGLVDLNVQTWFLEKEGWV